MDQVKNQAAILQKLQIDELNQMQQETQAAIESSAEVVLISPTGTGKTLAFLLPIVKALDPASSKIQVLILIPSRELALQIEQVIREMGTGFKANALYGGRPMTQDKTDLKHPPAILIGTPGRIADHLRKENFSVKRIQTLVLDEFDKSLETGFEADMREIIAALPEVKKKILTSATSQIAIPKFAGLKNPVYLNYADQGSAELTTKIVVSPSKNKLHTLLLLLKHLGNAPGIVFCNLKDDIREVSDFLSDNRIDHDCFYGGMEQKDRERALIKFRNGTHQLLIATDLAARGLDIPEIQFIIHFELPLKKEEFTHRNGRTARMNRNGTAYILKWKQQELPHYIKDAQAMDLSGRDIPKSDTPAWKTLYISGGRRDKISKGDIAGLFQKQGKLNKEELGLIEIKQDCAFVAVAASSVKSLLPLVNNSKLKTKKVRVSVV